MPSPRYRAFMMTATDQYEDLDSLEDKALRLPDVKYSVVTHDRDTGSNHYHLAIQIPNAMTINALANKLDIKANFIEKWDNRTYNMWAYMLHHTKDAKDLKADYTMYIDDPTKFRTNIQDYLSCTVPPAPGGKGAKLDSTIAKILTGEITRRELLKPENLTYYYENMRKIDNAIKLRTESLKYNPPACTTLYIHGGSGTGKTTKAMLLAQQLYADNYTVASTSNDLLQDYTGEKCLIIDDFRPQDHPFVELLALLDPYHRQRTHRSRYYNKPLATEMIIITSIYTLDATERYYKGINPYEELKQLRRLVQQTIELQPDSENSLYYDEQTDNYFPH